jgi:hypothetical protein
MRRLVTSLLAVVLVVVPILSSALKAAVPAELGPWPAAKAEGWAREHPWLVGCNFSPSTAINQLEMWQVDTFDRLNPPQATRLQCVVRRVSPPV